jgi:hypothetical protein
MENISLITTSQGPISKVYCEKFFLRNVSDKIITINYRTPSDNLSINQEEIYPGQTKNIWTLPDSLVIPEFFRNDIEIESQETLLGFDSGCIAPNIPYPAPININFSSRSSNPPNIRVEYVTTILPNIWDPTQFTCDWILLSEGTPSVCPNYTNFGTLTMTQPGWALILRVTLVSNNTIGIKFYMGPAFPQSCSYTTDWEPCNPNSQAFITGGMCSSCQGCGGPGLWNTKLCMFVVTIKLY